MLIILGGLPGTGKTTTAEILTRLLRAVYLRIDTIEHTLTAGKHIEKSSINDAGYAVAYALAEENLRLGQHVIADCVNPLEITRRSWRQTAERAGVSFLDVEFICSDPAEHRYRVENRICNLPGFVLPSWREVVERYYERRTDERLICDTAVMSAQEAADFISRHVSDFPIHGAEYP
ncbi:MAG: AAA family ATPase [Alphaproteobacteria bacterium]